MTNGQAAAAHIPAMMQMITGGWVAGMVGTIAELGIADQLAGGARKAEEIARLIDADEAAMYRLLRAGAAFGLVHEHAEHLFELTDMGRLLQAEQKGGSATLRDAAIFFKSHHCQRPWEEAAHSVRTGKTAFEKMYGCDAWKWYQDHPEDSRVFNNAMTALASSMHAAAVGAYDFSKFSTVVDVGGGHGHLIATILQQHQNATGIVFDLPHVVAGAAELFAKLGVTARARAEGGSFFEKVPVADAYVMSHILHDWDDAHCEKILKTCRAAGCPGHTLLAFDAVIKGPNEMDFGKLLDLEMLLVPGGRERTEPEFRELFKRAGYEVRRVIPTQSSVSIVEGVAI